LQASLGQEFLETLLLICIEKDKIPNSEIIVNEFGKSSNLLYILNKVVVLITDDYLVLFCNKFKIKIMILRKLFYVYFINDYIFC